MSEVAPFWSRSLVSPMRCMLVILAWLLIGLCPSSAFAADAPGTWPRQVTDLAGRRVRLAAPPQRIFLAQPRQLYSLLTLLDAPVERLAGWAYPLSVFDTAMAQRLAERWPALETLPTLSWSSTPDLDTEALLALAPDLVIFDLSQRSRIEGSALAGVLDRVGIPYLYTEFNRHPLRDTPDSLRLLGKALGVESRAEAINRLIRQHLARIDRRLTGVERRPEVLISIAPGLKVDCCRTNLGNGLADLVERAGGRNLAAKVAPVSGATLSKEWVLAHPPEVILNTAGQWDAGDGVRAGIGVSADDISGDLRHLSETLPGWPHLAAVREGRCYALWHGFHQGPFGIVALERIAKWLHPRRFDDLDPDATFATLLNEAGLPPGDGRFWGQLPAMKSLPPTSTTRYD
ncbi:iron complex transport system substrate-binding protein [Chromohalobacter canadensis]|uniref:Iron complex transport system substrate-binding protein n=1 Tax=Chromohalobacter canadensis TaxID=141389 RepID=A0A285VJ63_9GAMM|nr:ABC transporter substrate-binding protein [Chromohalobacter canadensis]SOC54100.1 iron complex transport system substrate-binding protein [Chromohalobacter canadensis]